MFVNVALPVIVILGILLTFSFPIYISLLTATLYLQIFVNEMPLQSVFTGMFEALNRNSLLAVPFFVVAGNLLATSSLGSRLVNFCSVLLKRTPGGLALSCIGSNAIFGAISGSAAAATATFGKILWTPLREVYGDQEAAGLITSSSSLSNIIPPSMSMIVFAIVTETSLARLFMAGFLPGVLCVAILAVYLRAKYRKDVVNAAWAPGERSAAVIQAIPALLLPIIILGGIYGGLCSPTEAGAISAVYATVVSLFIIRDINLRQFAQVFLSSAKTIGQVFILIAASTAFSQALTVTQAPRALMALMRGLSPGMFLLILNIILLIMGLFFDPGAANLIIAPLLVPIGIALGLDRVHLGIVFALNISIGMFTPPFGLSLFVSQSILERPMALIAKGCLPYFFCYIIALIIVTYVPQLSLILPRLLI
ncbi:MAG: TRAP transporter large permease subunit [Synergistaceae bacterium]|nr:TRAP transporter large permease subunit [Synergistaceae bacterium]